MQRLADEIHFHGRHHPLPQISPTQESHAIEIQPLKLREPCILTYLGTYLGTQVGRKLTSSSFSPPPLVHTLHKRFVQTRYHGQALVEDRPGLGRT
jgi:hypothetical protein